MEDLRSKSLLLTAYAEHLLNQIAERTFDGSYPFEIITPSNPLQRGAQLSVLLREELMEDVSKSLEAAGIICDKRKPGCIRVAPAPLYNTFSDILPLHAHIRTSGAAAGGGGAGKSGGSGGKALSDVRYDYTFNTMKFN